MVFVQFIEDFEEDVLVGSDDGLGDFIVLVEQTSCDLHNIVNSIYVPLQECQCEGREPIIEGQAIVADDDPLPVIQNGLLLYESLNHVEVAALAISLVIVSHLGQHEHEEGRILLKGHLRPILRHWVIDPTDIGAHEALLLVEPLDEELDGLMALAEPSEHVVEVTIIDFELILEVVLKLIDHHILGRLLHLLEHLVHIVVILRFLVLVTVVVRVVEEYQLEFLTRSVQFTIFELQLVPAGDALCVHVGTGAPLEAVGMGLQVDVVLLVLLHDQVSQVVLVIDDLEDLSTPRKDEVCAIIGTDGLRRLLLLSTLDVGAGVGGGVLEVAALGCHDGINVYQFLLSLGNLLNTLIYIQIQSARHIELHIKCACHFNQITIQGMPQGKRGETPSPIYVYCQRQQFQEDELKAQHQHELGARDGSRHYHLSDSIHVRRQTGSKEESGIRQRIKETQPLDDTDGEDADCYCWQEAEKRVAIQADQLSIF